MLAMELSFPVTPQAILTEVAFSIRNNGLDSNYVRYRKQSLVAVQLRA